MMRQENNIFRGDIITFTYNGGSSPGSFRTIFVLTNYNNNSIRGWDFDKSVIRTFMKSKMVNIHFLDEKYIKTCPQSLLPSNITVNQIIQEYYNDGYKVFYDNEFDEKYIIAIKPDCCSKKYLIGDFNQRTIMFDKYMLVIHPNNSVSLHEIDNKTYSYNTLNNHVSINDLSYMLLELIKG